MPDSIARILRLNDWRDRVLPLVQWLWRDAVWRFRAPMMVSILASTIGLFCQCTAYTLAYAYARVIEGGGAMNILNIHIDARSSSWLLFADGCLVLVMMGAAAVLIFYAAEKNLEIRRRYQDFCHRRAIVVASHLPHPESPRANAMLATGMLSSGLDRECRVCGRVLGMVLDVIKPLGMLVFFVSALLYINVFLTCVVLPILIVLMLVVTRISYGASTLARASEEHKDLAADDRRQAMSRLHRSSTAMPYTAPSLQALDTGMYARGEDLYMERFRLQDRSQLAVNLITALAMFVVILVAGAGMQLQAISWSVLIAYLLSLRMCLSNVNKLGSVMTKTGRFYHLLKRVHDFMSSAGKLGTLDIAEPVDCPEVTLNLHSMQDDRRAISLERGRRAWLCSSLRAPDRALACHLHGLIDQPRGAAPPMFWFLSSFHSNSESVRDVYGFPPDVSGESVLADLMAVRPDIFTTETPPPGLDRPLATLDAVYSDGSGGAMLKVVAAMHSKRPIWLFDYKDMDALNKNTKGETRRPLDEAIACITCPPERLASRVCADDLVLVGNGTAFNTWCTGEWFKAHPDICDALLEADTTSLSRRGGAMNDSDNTFDDGEP